jgi:hypothetical protein
MRRDVVFESVHMTNAQLGPQDPDAAKHMRSVFGSQQVDQQIRQAIQFCWMALPPQRQTVAEVQQQIRRIVDRALRDLREDAASFELPGD